MAFFLAVVYNYGAASTDMNRQVNELLTQINNCSDKGVFVLTASNLPDKMDDAIKRSGRLDKKIRNYLLTYS